MPPTTRPHAVRRYAHVTSDVRRLAAVRATGLPEGRGPRDRFQRLAATTARLLAAPVAIISLVDADRDVWVSTVGVPPALAAAGGTTLRPSFCQAIIAETGAQLAIRDARADPIFSTFPSVIGLGVVACLGVPLTTRGGHALGSCCVYDYTVRDWTNDDIDSLHTLAAGAVSEMERLSGAVFRDEAGAAVVRYLSAALDSVDTFCQVMPGSCNTTRITRISRAAGAVARHFSTLFRPLPAPTEHQATLDVPTTLHDAWRLLQILAGDEASVTLDLADALPPARLDAARLVRVLVTLVGAARDAVGGRGWIQIAAEPAAPPHGVRLTLRALSSGEPLGVPVPQSVVSTADDLLRCCGGSVRLGDDATVVASLPGAEAGSHRPA